MNITNITWYNPNTMIIDEKQLFETIINTATDKLFYVSLYLVVFLFIKIFLYDMTKKYLDKEYKNEKFSFNPYKFLAIFLDGIIWLCALYIFNIMLQIKFS